MTIFSLYIFDRSVFWLIVYINRIYLMQFLRHCTCVYYHDWNRTVPPKPATKGGILPAVSRSLTAQPRTSEISPPNIIFSPRNTLTSTASAGMSTDDESKRASASSWLPTNTSIQPAQPTMMTLPFEEEAKLVYGVILSLRNLVKKLSKRSLSLIAFHTLLTSVLEMSYSPIIERRPTNCIFMRHHLAINSCY